MNTRYVIRQLGLLLIVLSVAILLTTAFAWYDWYYAPTAEWRESQMAGIQAMLSTVFVGLVVGGSMMIWARKADDHLGRREAMLLVAMSWLVGAALAALPFRMWAGLDDYAVDDHPFHHFIDCYFESMSGLTTTGATVLSNIEAVPRGLLVWRAATHWLGGLGIVVLFVAVLPSLGVGGKRLFQVEAPGPAQPGVRPRIRETARVLWLIYVGLTIVQTLLLLLSGMDFIDALSHTFATLATGGFSTQNESMGAFGFAAQGIVIVFMMLAGANFGLYYQLIRGQWRAVLRDPELRLYLMILAVGTCVVGASVYGQPIVTTAGETVPGTAVRSAWEAAFQVVSVQTTTGYGTADFDRWPFFAKATLVFLMFIGGCAGSTGGGIKVIRVLIILRVLSAEIQKTFSPNVVRPLKVGKATVDQDQRLSALSYALFIMLLFGVGAALIMAFEPGGSISFTTAATASAATLNNIGPGLEAVGAVRNYGFFSGGSKVVMSILMVLGRLEVFAILVLLTPGFWKND